jgi:hypothetical protein
LVCTFDFSREFSRSPLLSRAGVLGALFLLLCDVKYDSFSVRWDGREATPKKMISDKLEDFFLLFVGRVDAEQEAKCQVEKRSSEKTSLRDAGDKDEEILTKPLDSLRFRLDLTAADADEVAAAAVVDEHPFCLEV